MWELYQHFNTNVILENISVSKKSKKLILLFNCPVCNFLKEKHRSKILRINAAFSLKGKTKNCENYYCNECCDYDKNIGE